MSITLPGEPVESYLPKRQTRRVFDHVPRLRELWSNGGWPGVTYAQCCIHNLKAANDREDRPAHLSRIEASEFYSIVGPKGEAQMALVGCGKRIQGAAPEGGERLFFTDGEVEELTGFPVEYPIWFSEPMVMTEPEPEPEPVVVQAPPPIQAVKRKYVRRGTKRVRGRYTDAKEVSHGARSIEPGAQAGAGQGGEGAARVQDRDPA
jgi:hypothetical protein